MSRAFVPIAVSVKDTAALEFVSNAFVRLQSVGSGADVAAGGARMSRENINQQFRTWADAAIIALDHVEIRTLDSQFLS